MYKSEGVEKPEFVNDNEQVHYIGRGIECQVFEIVAQKLVCKIYATHADAKYCFTLQRIAYRAGIAPEPLGLEKNYYFSRYLESYDKMDSDVPALTLWGIASHHKTSFAKIKSSEEYEELMDKIYNIFGGDWIDGHSGNVGIIFVNGIRKYMIIDFGIAGFNNTKLGKLLSEKLEVYY